ncbi:MAG: hypothetical protein AAF480_14220 [Actinomycetota bacterium]
MSLLGSGTRTRRLGSGTFRCPRERSSRQYELKAVQRWAFLRRVPLVRLGEVGRYVECRSCGSTFDHGVLAHPGDAPVEDVLTRILRRAAGSLLPDGPLSQEERREAVIVLQRYTNIPYSTDTLENDLGRPDREHLDEELQALASSLNERGRDAVVDAGVLLVNPQGAVAPDEGRVAALERIAENLAIPSERIRAAIESRRNALVSFG